jgi:hypothetical protein
MNAPRLLLRVGLILPQPILSPAEAGDYAAAPSSSVDDRACGRVSEAKRFSSSGTSQRAFPRSSECRVRSRSSAPRRSHFRCNESRQDAARDGSEAMAFLVDLLACSSTARHRVLRDLRHGQDLNGRTTYATR